MKSYCKTKGIGPEKFQVAPILSNLTPDDCEVAPTLSKLAPAVSDSKNGPGGIPKKDDIFVPCNHAFDFVD